MAFARFDQFGQYNHHHSFPVVRLKKEDPYDMLREEERISLTGLVSDFGGLAGLLVGMNIWGNFNTLMDLAVCKRMRGPWHFAECPCRAFLHWPCRAVCRMPAVSRYRVPCKLF